MYGNSHGTACKPMTFVLLLYRDRRDKMLCHRSARTVLSLSVPPSHSGARIRPTHRWRLTSLRGAMRGCESEMVWPPDNHATDRVKRVQV